MLVLLLLLLLLLLLHEGRDREDKLGEQSIVVLGRAGGEGVNEGG